MDTSKWIAFAQALGVDYKALKQLIDTKIDSATVTQLIEQAKTAVKNDILGEGAVVQKLADLGTRLDSFANVDLVATYNAAKA